MEQSACLHADETMAVCCPSVCDLWGVQHRIMLERLWHQMAFQKYTLKQFQPDPLAHTDPTPPLKLSFHYSSQRYNPASTWKEQCKYISFLPLFGFISASLTHGDSTRWKRNSWISWNFRTLSRHLIAECQSLFSDTTLNLQLWQRHSIAVRSARVWAPVRGFSRELLKAPNEALMEAVYALTGLFVVVVLRYLFILFRIRFSFLSEHNFLLCFYQTLFTFHVTKNWNRSFRLRVNLKLIFYIVHSTNTH